MTPSPAPDSAPAPRPPLQARSRRTLARLVEAGLDLVAEQGLDALTVQAVVARAGSSVGSFYARFAGRDELIRHLRDSLGTGAAARWDAALAGRVDPDAPLAARVRAVVELAVEGLRADDRPRRALAALGGEGARVLERHRAERVAALLLERSAEIGHPDPGTAVRLGYAAVLGAAGTALAPSDAEPGDARLTDELVRLWLAYLGADGGDAVGEPGDVDFFDVWA